jgi:ABC-type transporter Mla MlaB component
MKPVSLVLEGKLIGDWVPELRAVWNSCQPKAADKGVVVGLSGISSVDLAGMKLLEEIHAAGAVLTGCGLLARTLIEEVTGESSWC